MNNIRGRHHVFNNESKYSMGHSGRYSGGDGPFSGALPIPVSRKTVPGSYNGRCVQRDGPSMSAELRALSRSASALFKFLVRLARDDVVFELLTSVCLSRGCGCVGSAPGGGAFGDGEPPRARRGRRSVVAMIML